MPLTQKYIVRPVISNLEDEAATEGKAFPQEDYFVLLKQDMLASQALWGYVGALHVAVELLPDGQQKSEIAILADNIADLAFAWDGTSDKKLPD